MTSSFEQVRHTGPMTSEMFSRVREAMAKREERAPNLGDEAPDFELPLLHGDGEAVRLLDLRGRPVALIFGSYT